MTTPTFDYDGAGSLINVDPHGMEASSKRLQSLADEVATVVKHINDTVFTLELGWAGQTADEAQAFANKWNSKMDELFGSKDHPEDGVLIVMAAGLEAAAIGFSQTNAYVTQTFNEFAGALANPGSSSGTPGTAPPDQGNGTAVTEDFPN